MLQSDQWKSGIGSGDIELCGKLYVALQSVKEREFFGREEGIIFMPDCTIVCGDLNIESVLFFSAMQNLKSRNAPAYGGHGGHFPPNSTGNTS